MVCGLLHYFCPNLGSCLKDHESYAVAHDNPFFRKTGIYEFSGNCLTRQLSNSCGKERKEGLQMRDAFPPLPLLPATHDTGERFVIKRCFHGVLNLLRVWWFCQGKAEWPLWAGIPRPVQTNPSPLLRVLRRGNDARHLKLSYGEVSIKA